MFRLMMGLLTAGLFSCMLACQPAPTTLTPACLRELTLDTNAIKAFEFPYDLEEPVGLINLPPDLEEISGIGIADNPRYLLAIQDEDGILFYVDLLSGSVRRQVPFWKDGDYEGVESTPDGVFVVKSTGTLYRIRQEGEEEPVVDKFNTFLDGDNDVEGLAYDMQANKLLLACKAKAGEGDDFELKKAIYAFDLASNQLEPVPQICVSLEEVHRYLETNPTIRKLEKIQEFFAPDESEFGFSPSGIAIHPQTGHLYITSSVGKLLMVVDRQGKILHIEKLKKSIHPQPEGICFTEDGTLYIANEGKDGEGRIFKFRPIR